MFTLQAHNQVSTHENFVTLHHQFHHTNNMMLCIIKTVNANQEKNINK